MTKLPDMIADTQTALLWLLAADGSNGNVGAVGFGLGGTAINNAVTKLSDLKAAVTYYGHPPPPAEVEKIQVPVLFNFVGKDQFIDPEIPEFVDALKKAHVKYELYKYDNTVRGFEDDSAPAHYSAEAATLAWARTNEFLKKMLK